MNTVRGAASRPTDRVDISPWGDGKTVHLAFWDTLPGGVTSTSGVVLVDRDSLLDALTEVGLIPDTGDVVVREADLPEVTWDPARRCWETPDAMLTPRWYTDAQLDEREREALAALALVRHARTHEPPKPEPTNAERLAELIADAPDARSAGIVLDAAGVKAPEVTR